MHGQMGEMTAGNAFLLYVQVSERLHRTNNRSNYIRLIVLSCPRTCLQSFHAMMPLSPSGDVELNPGFMTKGQEELLYNVRAVVTTLEEPQNILLNEIKEIRRTKQ